MRRSRREFADGVVLGLDGCSGGWCAVRLETDGDRVNVRQTAVLTTAEALATDAEMICVDVPIGLIDVPGPRGCDVEARRLLGRPRASSVFPAPSRHILSMDLSQAGYRAASDENRRVTVRGLTRQTFNIARKIKEVDDALTPELQHRVREVHPELCFWALNGRRPMRHNKKKSAGRNERWAILRRLLPALPPSPELSSEIKSRCGVDDYIDATVAAWTAVCIVRGEAQRIPMAPAPDARGLRMEMWFPHPSHRPP